MPFKIKEDGNDKARVWGPSGPKSKKPMTIQKLH